MVPLSHNVNKLFYLKDKPRPSCIFSDGGRWRSPQMFLGKRKVSVHFLPVISASVFLFSRRLVLTAVSRLRSRCLGSSRNARCVPSLNDRGEGQNLCLKRFPVPGVPPIPLPPYRGSKVAPINYETGRDEAGCRTEVSVQSVSNTCCH